MKGFVVAVASTGVSQATRATCGDKVDADEVAHCRAPELREGAVSIQVHVEVGLRAGGPI